MFKIRYKIITGFMILGIMLVISGLISIYELTKLGNQVNRLLMDNYRSIDFSKQMNYNLGLQERAILLSIQGDKGKANSLFSNAVSIFNENLLKASNNLTIPGEAGTVDSIAIAFSLFKTKAEGFINEPSPNVSEYLTEVNPALQMVRSKVEELLTLNQQNLNQTVAVLEKSPYRTILPGLIIVITSVIFTIIFNYMISYYLLSPIGKITKGIQNFTKYRRQYEVTIETRDEMYELNESVKDLILTKSIQKKAE
jgi:HAMP domain-containing protein